MSAFVLEDGVVYHTYSTYARGLDGLWGMYQWLDRAPRGRNETGPLVPPPRRVRQGLSEAVAVAPQWRDRNLTRMSSERALLQEENLE